MGLPATKLGVRDHLNRMIDFITHQTKGYFSYNIDENRKQ
jgi:hypothetical protein